MTKTPIMIWPGTLRELGVSYRVHRSPGLKTLVGVPMYRTVTHPVVVESPLEVELDIVLSLSSLEVFRLLLVFGFFGVRFVF